MGAVASTNWLCQHLTAVAKRAQKDATSRLSHGSCSWSGTLTGRANRLAPRDCTCYAASGECGSDQFRQRRAFGQGLRAAGRVGDRRRLGVETHVAVERREDVAEADRPVLRIAADAVGRADHLTGLHPAAGQDRAADRLPVVASALL